MSPPQHRSETNVGDEAGEWRSGWNKRDWWPAYQRREDFQAEGRASANTAMSVNAF
jgi:hypothetical protein